VCVCERERGVCLGYRCYAGFGDIEAYAAMKREREREEDKK